MISEFLFFKFGKNKMKKSKCSLYFCIVWKWWKKEEAEYWYAAQVSANDA